MNKQRTSGLELLRIISMFLIIAYHYMIFGGYEPFTVENFAGGGELFVQSISMFGRMANSIYAMISGYFLINRESTDFTKSVLIVFDVVFFTTVIAVVVWATGIVPITLQDIIYSGLYWYIIFYLIFSFFAPYVNKLLRLLDREMFIKLLALMFFFWSVIPTFTFRKIDFSELDFFIVMYTVGAYIRLHVREKTTFRNQKRLMIALCSAAFMVLSVIVFDVLGIVTGRDFFVVNACYFREFNMIPAVVCAVFLFLYFANTTFYSKTINYVAGSSLHILIIHLNEFLRRWIWEVVYPNAEYISCPYIHAPVKIICVFVGCLTISVVYRRTVRKLAERTVERWQTILSAQGT